MPETPAQSQSKLTLDCRCWGCGSSDPQHCGVLCIDCSWEEHLAGMAHTGDFDEPREDTPKCCLASRAAERARWTDA